MTQDPTSRAARQLALLDHAERIAGMGRWAWTLEPEEVLWSDNHFRLFGCAPGEIVPSLDFVVSRVHPDDRARMEESMRAAPVSPHLEITYRIIRMDGAIRDLHVTVATIEHDGQTPTQIVGSVTDVSLRLRLDRQLAAHAAVTRALDDWMSLRQGAGDLLRRLAQALELGFATFWVAEGSKLRARAVWHPASAALEPVAEATLRSRPGSAAIAARALAAREPLIRADAAHGERGGRRAAIRAAGLSGALAIPAVHGDETLAVLEFLSADAVEPSDRLMQALDGIGHEIGHFLSRRRGELTASVMTTSEREVLQLAADGHPAAQIASQMYLSPATVKRHFERAYAALGVSDRAGAVAEAMRRGLIS